MGPSAIEFVDKTTLTQIKFKFDKKIKCLLFVEFDEKIDSSEKKIKSIITKKIIKKFQKVYYYSVASLINSESCLVFP
jgi:hypothetical protein